MAEATDPMDAVSEAMRTVVGSQELALRMKLGNDGFETWMRRDDQLQEAQIGGAIWDAAYKRHSATLVEAQVKYVGAKASLWSALAFATVIATGCGLAEFIRWIA